MFALGGVAAAPVLFELSVLLQALEPPANAPKTAEHAALLPPPQAIIAKVKMHEIKIFI